MKFERDGGRNVEEINNILKSLEAEHPESARKPAQRLYALEFEIHRWVKRWKKEVAAHKSDNQIFANLVEQREMWRNLAIRLLPEIQGIVSESEVDRLISSHMSERSDQPISVPRNEIENR